MENCIEINIGPAECLAGDGTNGYAVLDISSRLTSKTGGTGNCDITTAPSWTKKSLDWKGDLKWYRFGATGLGMIIKFLIQSQ